MWNQFTSLSEEKIFKNTFSINSLFKIGNGDEVVHAAPKVRSIFDSKRVAIAIDECLVMFDDETFRNCKCLNFEAIIDCLTVSSNGALIICGLTNGAIYGIHIKGVPVFSVEINADHIDVDREKTFVDIHEYNAEYFLICKNGQIYKLYNIQNDELSQTIEELDENASINLNETLSNNVLLDLMPTKQRPRGSAVNSFGISTYAENSLLMYSGREYVFMKNLMVESKIPLPLDIGNIVSIQSCGDTTLTLTDRGDLYELCQYSRLFIPRPMADDDFILCFNLMENNDDVELLALVESGATKETHLKIFDFPCMTCKFALPVPKQSWIINQSKSTANIYYICGSCDDANVFKHVEMRMISEVQPENRLKTLIKKGLLDEAEAFATTFKLSLQPIYEAKATQILTDIGTIDQRNIEAVQKRFDDLLNMAKLITNTEFLLKMRSMEMHDRKIMQKFLKFLVAHIKFDNYQKEFEEINEQLLRLETLGLIDMYECDLQWQKFVNHSNLITYCFKFFETDISKACLILRQHASSILPNLKETMVLKTMNTIPQHTSPFDIIQWMRHYMPIVTKAHPQALPTLAEWTIQKTTSYQLLKDWPEIGLEFGNSMFHIFEEVDYLFPDTRRQYDICIDKFRRVINALEELSVLKIRFNLTLTFDDYMNESIEDSAYRILLRINLKNFKKLVDEFLFTIFNENGMDLLPTLVRYIDFLIRSRKNSNVWEERAIACTQLIHNEEEKVKCAIRIMKSATVPWSKALETWSRKLRSSSHPLAADIINEYQMQKLKIIKLKYGWNPDVICNNKFQFVARMVKRNDDDLFTDLKEFVEGNSALKRSAYFYCAHELARTGNIDRAIRFMDSLKNEKDFAQCCNQIVSITTKLIEDELENAEAFDQMMELLKYVLMKQPNDELSNIIQSLQGVQQLRREFGMNVTQASLSDRSKTEEFLDQSIDKLIDILGNQKSNFAQKAWTTIQRIASVLYLDVVHVALKLSTRVDNVRFTCSIARIILDSAKMTAINCSLYVDFALLLIAQQCYVLEGPMVDSYSVSLSYPLAYCILFRIDQFGNEDVRDLLNFTRIGFDAFSLERVHQYLNSNTDDDDNMIAMAFDQKSEISKVKRRDSLLVFEEVNQVQRSPLLEHKSDGIIKCLSLTMKALVVELKPKTSFYWKLKDVFTPRDVLSRSLLFTSLEHLIKIKLYFSAFAIIQFILSQQTQAERILLSNDTMKMMLRKMIKSALHQKEPHFDQILPILRSDPDPSECLRLLKKDLKNGPVKINCLMLQEKYGASSIDPTRVTSERETRLKYHYYMQLCQIDSSLKTDSNFEIVSFEQMFKDLRCKIIDVQLLEKMSKDFQWNFQKVLICQIVTILSIQQMEFDTEIDLIGNEHIVVKVSTDKIRAQCQPYLDHVIDTKQLASRLYEFLDSVNSYFYELYLCIIDILAEMRALRKEMELWSNILLFLKMKMVTKRTKRTSQMETDWWLKTQNDSGVLPKIAKYRFPFQMLIDHPLKDVLDDEVNVENCAQWFPLVQLHMNLKKSVTLAEVYSEQDYYCMSAIKNSISKYKADNDTVGVEVWNLQPINNGFLQAILHLVKQMKDIQRIIFVLYFVCNHAPEGADQVEAAYECYQFAIENEQKLRETARGYETVVKIKRKYPMLKIQHLLHLYGLKDDKLFQLVENPMELITTLYQHGSLLKSDNKIDLNQVTKEVAELHGLNFYEIQMDLLKKWLSFTTLDTNETLEETFYNDLNASVVKIEDDVEIDNESVARAYYILKSWDAKTSFEFLVSHVLPSDDESSVNTGRQLQVFDCLIKLVNDDTETAFVDLVSTSHYIALKCVHSLHSFGFKFSVIKFQSYDKMRILKQLWSTNANNPKALDVITSICVGYEIYEPVIWNNLLKQMVNLHMTKELRTIIDTVSAKHSLVHLDGLVAAWEYLIRMPFKTIHKLRTDEQDANLCRSLFLLQSCPVKTKMNLLELAELCVRFRQVHIAAILIAFVGDEHRSKVIEMITGLRNDSLKNDIIYLRELGIYPFVVDFAINKLNL